MFYVFRSYSESKKILAESISAVSLFQGNMSETMHCKQNELCKNNLYIGISYRPTTKKYPLYPDKQYSAIGFFLKPHEKYKLFDVISKELSLRIIDNLEIRDHRILSPCLNFE